MDSTPSFTGGWYVTTSEFPNMEKATKYSTPTFAGGWYATMIALCIGITYLNSTPTFAGGWHTTSSGNFYHLIFYRIAHLLLPAVCSRGLADIC